MAAVSTGELTADCNICRMQPNLKTGCEHDEDFPLWDDIEGNTYYACPLNFVSPAVNGFLRLYNAYRSGLVRLPDFMDLPARYYDAVAYYENMRELMTPKKGK